MGRDKILSNSSSIIGRAGWRWIYRWKASS